MIIAIDPGASGGIAAWAECDATPPKVWPMPESPADLREILRDLLLEAAARPTIYLEQLVKFAGKAQSGSAAIVYGRNYGVIEGACAALELPIREVPARTWQKFHGLHRAKNETKTQWKNRLKARAQQRFPQVEKITLAVADALLILDYGLRQPAIGVGR